MLGIHTQYQKKLWGLILTTVFVKILLSLLLELGNDEVYYFTYALQPDWNHFDHPPMVGWMIQLTTLNLYWLSELSMRLGSIISAAFATVLVFKTGAILKNERAGFLAALLYSLSIYTSIIAGLFVLPDSPQMVFYCASIYLMVKWVMQAGTFKNYHWILLGLFIGLATLSKVHGLFLWVGFGAYLIFHQTKTFKEPYLYVAGMLTILCLIPILFWNVENDFITYRYHSERVTNSGIQLDSFMQQILGEMLYQNPLVYLICLIPLIRFKQLKIAFNNKGSFQILIWLSFPLLLIFWGIALFNPTLPHWTGPAYIGLFLIAGVYWSQWSTQIWPVLFKGALSFFIILMLGFVGLVYVFPIQLGSSKEINLGEYNPINDVTGWHAFKSHFESIVANDVQEKKMSQNAPILTNKWFPGGHILFYIAQPLHKRVIGLGKLEDLHKFAWLNKTQATLQKGENAYCIIPSNLPADPQALYGNYFEKIELAASIPIISNGVALRKFKVYRLLHCRQVPIDILPSLKK